MTQITSKKVVRRGRIFPELTISPEELARREAEDEIFYQRCLAIFERVRTEYIESHYGWYIAVEPNSREYLIDKDRMQAHKRMLEKYFQARIKKFYKNLCLLKLMLLLRLIMHLWNYKGN
ncbi:hypothetical protein MEN41_11310 [Dolichospermum sp. ST_con]|nr:hypothetical protein [Dolichospermum sp. ST_con]MDD1420357.1 hypothetical protein [Dolichospermum sp. ST_sed1]MDD1432157.1 hypothetical protein [Dolichospermum sp. ST_sed6]MDD1437507.1 hypothetical protein [Dolichospermum sp. ST_sed10]MDD1441108.1 hypothetical protein [Dolichospermum sp. ST_sed3]MDD1449065.1 hypothetical protein [Dolichospermum sp. ST_sed8]MDD1461464.1 hypothetical protein [Dolichospermum sp. ST_sed2]MDD1469046.1 hypothetical protein [Dolichospermum sp. ST_sed5]MDD147121